MTIKIINHYACPEDQYIKEVAIVQLDDKYNITYLRKTKKDGGLFWGPLSAGVTKDGSKKFIDSIEFDSNFQRKEILSLLEARAWESKPISFTTVTPLVQHTQTQLQQMSFLEECPF